MQNRRVRYALLNLWVFIFGLTLMSYGVPRGGWHRGHAYGNPHRPGEIVIKPMVGTSIETIAQRYNVTIIDQVNDIGVWRVRIPSGGSEESILTAMDQDGTIDFSDLNYLMTNPEAQQESLAFVDQSDPPFIDGSSPPIYFNQPAYDQIGVRQAWAYTTGRNVKVAVVDTGVSSTHPALAGHIRPELGWNYVENNADPEDRPGGVASGHGTFVSGLIARVAPNATIIPIRALNPDGIGDTFNVARAIVRGANVGAHIINLSIGLTSPACVIDDALDFADEAGATVIAAAGNNNREETQYIASYPTVLGIAAVDACDLRAPFSNYGAYVGAVSPGVGLYSTFINRQFASWSGTSFSTALVTGQAALLKALRPELTPADIVVIIQLAADNVDALNPEYVGRLGYGRIQCMSAVSLLQ